MPHNGLSVGLKPRLIDFGSAEDAPGFSHSKHLRLGGVSVSRAVSSPNPGTAFAAEQTMVVLHRGAPVALEWRELGSKRRQVAQLRPGLLQIGSGSRPLWVRWDQPADFLAIALDATVIARAGEDLAVGDVEVQTRIAAKDEVLRTLAGLYDDELENGAAGGRLYADSLTAVLAVHLLRHYGARPREIPIAKGGLPPARLRRVLDYLHAHLDTDLSLDELAAVAGLTRHHFAQAFKSSVGEPPHRYVVEHRVVRAAELLAQSSASIAEIAVAVGFANQSHLTHHFRRTHGVTPSCFRRNL
jgi:AraC family transcriptional regulator